MRCVSKIVLSAAVNPSLICGLIHCFLQKKMTINQYGRQLESTYSEHVKL